MNSARRLAFLLSIVVISFAVAWDFTPRTSSRNRQESEVESSRPATKARSGNLNTYAPNKIFSTSLLPGPVPEPTVVPVDPEGEEDPDLPPGMAGKIDKDNKLVLIVRAQDAYDFGGNSVLQPPDVLVGKGRVLLAQFDEVAVNLAQRRTPAIAGRDLGTHTFQGCDDSLHRSSRQRRVAHQLAHKVLSCQDAANHPHGRTGIADE